MLVDGIERTDGVSLPSLAGGVSDARQLVPVPAGGNVFHVFHRCPRPAARATFHAMSEGTQEDWNRIVASQLEFYPGLADRVTDHLRLLDGDFGGFAVDRLTHSLQTATRAYRDNRDDEYVACAHCCTTSATPWARTTTPTSPPQS